MVEAEVRAGFVRVLELFNLPDAAEAIRRALPEGARMFGQDHELERRVRALAQLDPEVMAGVELGDQHRAEGMRYQAGRLAEQGRLRPGVTAKDAAMLLFLLTDFDTYDALRTTWALDSEQIGEFMVEVARRQLLRG